MSRTFFMRHFSYFTPLFTCVAAIFTAFLIAFTLPTAVPEAHAQQQRKVEIFVTSWCPYCVRLEQWLKQNRVQYIKYDIEKSTAGKEKHEKLGGGGIPVIRIDKQVIRGFRPDVLSRIFSQ